MYPHHPAGVFRGHLQMSLPRCQVQGRAPRRVGRRNVATTTEALRRGAVAVAGRQVQSCGALEVRK